MATEYDFICIGAGSAGVRAARVAASLGAKTLVVEKGRLGGTCVNVGCVPKKLWVYAAACHHDFAISKSFGWDVEAPAAVHWQRLMRNKNNEIDRLNRIYDKLLHTAGVTLIRGTAGFVDDRTLKIRQVDDHGSATETRVRGKNILICTGGKPTLPAEVSHDAVITSDEAFYLDKLPERVAVVGGGYIGVEFAGIFAGLGSRTTLLYRGPQLLRHFDHELGEQLAECLPRNNIDLRLNCRIHGIQRHGEERVISLADGETLRVDQVLYATGRHPDTKNLGLETTGVRLNERGAVVVGKTEGTTGIAEYRTSVAHIYAAGDVTDRIQLTPVAIAEGMVIAHGLFGAGHPAPNYQLIATAVFSIPELATVGLSERQAYAQHGEDGVAIFASSFRPMKHTLSDNPERVFIKMVVQRENDKVLGVHMLGPAAAEIIQSVAVALTAGATKSDFDRTMAIHPSTAEELVTMRTPRGASAEFSSGV